MDENDRYMNENEQYIEAEEKSGEQISINLAQKPIITYTLISINIVVFIITYLYGYINNVDANLVFGMKVNSLIMQGEYWRLFMPIFLHGGIMHLAVNSYSLYAVGPTVESIYGRKKFLAIYLLAGVTGNVASFVLSVNPSVGASGAIFGLLGALLYLLQKDRKALKSSFGISIIAIIVINIVYGFSNSGIDNFAHLGGLIGGYLAAVSFGFFWEKEVGGNRILVGLLIPVLIFGGVYIGSNTGSNLALSLLDQASISFDNKDYTKTEELARKAESLGVSNSSIKATMYDLIAASLLNQDKPKPAFDYAKKLVALNPERGYYLLGFYYLRTGDQKLARENFQKALNLDPGNTDIKGILDSLPK